MNVHVSCKIVKTPDLEREINLQTEKLRRRLQVFRPELVHLHAGIEQNSAREGVTISLNLRLPSGQMAVAQAGTNVTAAVKRAFEDLLEQLAKHMERLRAAHRRIHRREADRPNPLEQVPFEQTLAAVKLPMVCDADISSYVNANLYRLNRFVDRELRYREASGRMRPGLVSREEVIDETIAGALGDSVEKPERLALEPWLYRLALSAISDLAWHNSEDDVAVPLHQKTWKQNVRASDEPALQFHQPDESMIEQDNIPDRGTATPEEIAYNDEVLSLIDAALLGAEPADRHALLLYAVEGFTPEEIAAISDRSAAQVRQSILAAREHLCKALPAQNEWRDRLLHQTRIA